MKASIFAVAQKFDGEVSGLQFETLEDEPNWKTISAEDEVVQFGTVVADMTIGEVNVTLESKDGTLNGHWEHPITGNAASIQISSYDTRDLIDYLQYVIKLKH